MQILVVVPVLITLLAAVLLMQTARLLMVIATAMLTAMYMVIVVMMFTVLKVMILTRLVPLDNIASTPITDPSTCAEIGITTCCDDVTDCEVSSGDSHCSCDISCHRRNDCCEDAVEIGCTKRRFS